MKCKKCGRVLEDNAVFCDKCGTLVILKTKAEAEDKSEFTGKRIRNRSDVWLYFRLSSWIIMVIAGILAVFIGYMIVSDNDRQSAPYLSDRQVWGESWIGTKWHGGLKNDNINYYTQEYEQY